jgi:hypothetical protein
VGHIGADTGPSECNKKNAPGYGSLYSFLFQADTIVHIFYGGAIFLMHHRLDMGPNSLPGPGSGGGLFPYIFDIIGLKNYRFVAGALLWPFAAPPGPFTMVCNLRYEQKVIPVPGAPRASGCRKKGGW